MFFDLAHLLRNYPTHIFKRWGKMCIQDYILCIVCNKKDWEH